MADLTQMTDPDLEALYLAVNAEMGRRRTLAAIPEQVAELNRAYQTSSGYTDGAKWVQPEGTVGAYMMGNTVIHDPEETLYRSKIDFNVYEPGDPDDPQNYRWWEIVGAEVEGWAPGKEYKAGDQESYEDVLYLCLQDHTAQPGWEPDKVPALWQPMEV